MGLGNGNAKSGDKGSNFNYELKSLQGLAQSVAILGTLATESTLISVLNAIIAADQDIEILLVRDNGNGGVVVQQITNWETGTPVISYKDVNGNPYVPVGPLEYLDPSAVLNLILTEITALNNKIITDTDDGVLATDQTLPLNMAILYAEGDGAEVRLKTDYSIDNRLLVSSLITGTVPLPTGAATEALQTTLNALITTIDAVLDTIKVDTGIITLSKTATSINTTGSGSVPIGASEVSFFNNGSLDATVNGTPLPAGVTRTFGFKNDILVAIAYDGNGEQLLIDYMA